MEPAVQPRAFGRYVLLHRIAAGGMAEIFKAKYGVAGGIEKTCVIKRILPHLAHNEDFITMFHDEARITVQLSHANIVQVFDFGRIGQNHFLAMEYVHGQNLQRLLKRLRRSTTMLPIPIALYVASEVAKGLHYAHTKEGSTGAKLEIVHRDVSPANVLISYEGNVKLTDFGIAKAASKDAATKTGHIKGKASYLSPEQVLGRNIDCRADLFALGSVIWEMLVGRKLFAGDHELEIINKVTKERILPPSELNPAIPPALDGVVMKALQRNPLNRYRNADEMYRALQAVTKHLQADIASVEVGMYLQSIFQGEMQKERELDMEVSKSHPNVLQTAKDEEARAGQSTQLHDTSVSNPRPVRSGTLPPPTPRKGRGAMVAVALLGTLLVLAAAGLLASDQFGIALPFPNPVSKLVPRPTPSAPVPTPQPSATPTVEPTKVAVAPTPTPKPTPKRRGGHGPRATHSPRANAETPTPKPAASPTEFGKLFLESQPWGEIYINGKPTGRQTPAFGLELPVGTHHVRLYNPELKQEAFLVVTITKDTPARHRVTLKPANKVPQ